MEFLSILWTYAVPFLILLTLLVFVHELGHYLIARRCGVRIETFSIGFGPEIFGWTDRAQTRWKFAAIPLGGYVKMFGDADAASRPGAETAEMSPEDQAQSFHHKTLGQRSWIVAGGPLANFIFAFFAFLVLYLAYGERVAVETEPAQVGWVEPGSAADKGGLQADDRILTIDGQSISGFEDIVALVEAAPEKPLEFVVSRGGETLPLVVVPRQVTVQAEDGSDREIGRIGIGNRRIEYEPVGALDSIWMAGAETARVTGFVLQVVWEFLSGARDTEELAGPLGIAQMSGQMAERGFDQALLLAAYLSINLGLLNLFPIPMLDGGHLLFYAIEKVRGRPLGERAQEYGFRIGLALVLALMFFATVNDILRLT